MYEQELKRLRKIQMDNTEKTRIRKILCETRKGSETKHRKPMIILIAAIALCILCTACGITAYYLHERRNLAAFWEWDGARVLTTPVKTDFGNIYYASITDHTLFIMCRIADVPRGDDIIAKESFTAVLDTGKEYPLKSQNQAWSSVYDRDTAAVDWYVQYVAENIPVLDSLTLRYDATGEEIPLLFTNPDTKVYTYVCSGIQISTAQLSPYCPAAAISMRLEKGFGKGWLSEPEKLCLTVPLIGTDQTGTVYRTVCSLRPVGTGESCLVGLFTYDAGVPDTETVFTDIQLGQLLVQCLVKPSYTMQKMNMVAELAGRNICLPNNTLLQITAAGETDDGTFYIEAEDLPGMSASPVLCMPDGTIWYSDRVLRIEERDTLQYLFREAQAESTDSYAVYSEKAHKSKKVLFFIGEIEFTLTDIEYIEN